jgi:hypothetical protein
MVDNLFSTILFVLVVALAVAAATEIVNHGTGDQTLAAAQRIEAAPPADDAGARPAAGTPPRAPLSPGRTHRNAPADTTTTVGSAS